MLRSFVFVGIATLAVALGVARVLDNAANLPQEQVPTRREFTIVARRYEFSPSRIEVNKGDLVSIRLTTADIPHSFTVDEYRVAKRIVPGRTTVVDFHATLPGEFPFYCNLTVDEGCRNMRGTLVVR